MVIIFWGMGRRSYVQAVPSPGLAPGVLFRTVFTTAYALWQADRGASYSYA